MTYTINIREDYNEKNYKTDYKEMIKDYLGRHPEMVQYLGVDDKRIADAVMEELINNTPWAEDAYPGIKERMLKLVKRGAKR